MEKLAVILLVGLFACDVQSMAHLDNGFVEKCKDEMTEYRKAFPMLCFYEPGTDPQLRTLYQEAASFWNSIVGDGQLYHKCMKWEEDLGLNAQSEGLIYLQREVLDCTDESCPYGRTTVVCGAENDWGYVNRGSIVRVSSSLTDEGKVLKVLIHELGHVLGLDDDYYPESIMHWQLNDHSIWVTGQDRKALADLFSSQDP